ncbi:MAG: hypothetical protein FWE50_03890 [Alphaproteobacteria bacterium]|nr:hypothetical protein [Alphaproteobacteria bacterium]
MNKKTIDILLPFIATVFLWRLSFPVLNPSGILALVPIFYYSFIRARGGFLPMALIGCFLIDHNFDTMLFWTMLFCAFYAAAGLQSHINLATQKWRGIFFFMIFIGCGLLLLGIWTIFVTWSMMPILQSVGMFITTTVMYIPLTYLLKRVEASHA